MVRGENPTYNNEQQLKHDMRRARGASRKDLRKASLIEDDPFVKSPRRELEQVYRITSELV